MMVVLAGGIVAAFVVGILPAKSHLGENAHCFAEHHSEIRLFLYLITLKIESNTV
jgi:hypothetical protein